VLGGQAYACPSSNNYRHCLSGYGLVGAIWGLWAQVITGDQGVNRKRFEIEETAFSLRKELEAID